VKRRRNGWSSRRWIAVTSGVAAALAGASYALLRSRRSDAGGIGPAPDYVPHLVNYPHKERFGNERAFGLILRQWGFNVGDIEAADWTIIHAQGINGVRSFQHQYNLVRRLEGLDPIPTDELEEDGLIGPMTAEAIWRAEQWTINMNVPWHGLVELAQEEVGS
jgi:hypothetical protein